MRIAAGSTLNAVPETTIGNEGASSTTEVSGQRGQRT
jgi:hypothetical protein